MAAPKQLLTGFAKTARTTKPDPKRKLTIRDPDSRGLFVRINPAGTRSWLVMSRDQDGKQVWATIGDAMTMELSEARKTASETIDRIKRGEVAKVVTTPPRTFAVVRDEFLKRHVRREGQSKSPLRSAREIHRIFCGPKYAKWVLGDRTEPAPAIASQYIPADWDGRPFGSIKRIDITEVLDEVQDEAGSRQADAVLAQLSSLFSWHASRDDDFVSPIVRRMKRTKAKEQEGKRTLSDDEIRTIWGAIDEIDATAAAEAKKEGKASYPWVFGVLVKVALLTMQRREKLAQMKWEDLSGDEWTIDTEDGEKGNAACLKLPPLAIGLIRSLPEVKGNAFVFHGRGKKAFNSFSDGKEVLDEKAPIKHWTLHDLRRTGRTLMSRARIGREIAEHVLGHAIPGVEGVYDRWAFFEEKGEALAALAALVERILANNTDNVVQMAEARA